MDSAEFLSLLKQRAPKGKEPAGDPLQQARVFIDKYGNTAEGAALVAVVRAIWKAEGHFSDTDVWLFSSEKLSLVSELIDARLEGRYQEYQWHRASCYPPWKYLLDLHKLLDK